MARFNTPAPARGPLVSERQATSRTFEGAPGFLRDDKSTLFLGAVSFFNEDTFYETADARIQRLAPLVHKIAVADPTWIVGFVTWLRGTANLRSVSIMVAAEAVAARLNVPVHGHNRQIVAASMLRLDEPGEFLGYWINRFGRLIPSAVKRGINDVLAETLTEYNWLKWRGKGVKQGGFTVADVVAMTRPKARTLGVGREALYHAVIEDHYGREFSLVNLPTVRARQDFLKADRATQDVLLANSDFVRTAGLTHEVVSAAFGGLGPAEWNALIPTMGFQAVLMNLRRMHEAGIGDQARGWVRERLRNPDKIRSSRMLPIRFLSAYRNAPLEFAGDLEFAANVILDNVPSLSGRTLVLVDRSGSMQKQLSERGTLARVDAANIFGAALALRAERADLIAYGNVTQVLPFRKGDSLLRLADSPANLGGTNTEGAVQYHYNGHDRIVLLTDEQASGWGYGTSLKGVFKSVPQDVPCFTWNLAGYPTGHAPEGPKRFTFGGLSDAGMNLILPLERGITQRWPWQ